MLKVLESASSSSSSDEQDSGVCSFLVVPVMETEDRRQQNTEAPVVPELSLLGPSNHGNVSGLPQVVPQGGGAGGVDLVQGLPHSVINALASFQMQIEQMFSPIQSQQTRMNQRLECLASRVDILERRMSTHSPHSPTGREVPQMIASDTSSQGGTEPFQWPGLEGEAKSASPPFAQLSEQAAAASVDHSPFAAPRDLPCVRDRTHPCYPRLSPLPPSPT